MAIRVVRLGTPRRKTEGLRLGTVRRPPRGVRKEDFAKLDYYDVWLPELSPSAELVSWALAKPFTPPRWAAFERRYLAEMSRPGAQHLISLLVEFSKNTDFSVGCYCENESECHRSVLKQLLIRQGAKVS
jgi:uncharacterized protein YeaO (DUF488 family)